MHEPIKQSTGNSEAQTKHLDRLLDEALADTFPASDPVAICSEDRAPEREPDEGRKPLGSSSGARPTDE